MSKARFFGYGAVALVMLAILSLSRIVDLVTDFYWFKALGFSDIFLITLKSKVFLFAAAAFLTFIFLNINIVISSKINGPGNNVVPYRLKLFIALLISVAGGVIASGSWLVFQQYLNFSEFGISDPIFGLDVAFYAFQLPFWRAVLSYILGLTIVTAALAAMDYLQAFLIQQFKREGGDEPLNVSKPTIKTILSKIRRKGSVHLFLLASMVFVVLAALHYLNRFSIMFSDKGIVVGAGYSDVVAYLPMVTILTVIALVIAAMFIIWVFAYAKPERFKKRYILAYAIIVYVIFAVFGTTVIPGIVQSLVVTPNEINLEKEYIAHNINFTRIAYGLDSVEEYVFDVDEELKMSDLDANRETMDNIRILDWRPLTQTYKQTQEIRLYYDLSGIDIDRYYIDGRYTEVMLAPREMDQSKIASNAKTWMNLHMVYTHGYGLVMSPVNSVTSQGLPDYLIKDIPPVTTADEKDIEVDMPEIYYGEKDNGYVVVNTKADEFNYPKGNANEYITYEGKGGVVLDSWFKRLLFAFRFRDIKLLLSSDIEPESRIMFNRQILGRISKITPFVMLDSDPYIVISEGKVYWISDGYTVTGNFPYSEKIAGINYIRNSIKMVMDAYDGSVTYYIMDKDEPMMKTYAKIFPKQFKLFENMPEGLKSHIRYPEDMFRIQSMIYNDYHMGDPTVFYNKEDAWQIPHEIYGVGQQVEVDPYNIIMKLPGEEKEEFILMTTFTPIRKDNMVGWMAARSDGEKYGGLVVYRFPKDKLIFGPLQIEAKIDQDSEISQQLTLWSQQGSRVTRGNLLVIPVDGSLLYVEPLYIQAETGQLPELKRIIVSDGTKVIMEKDLDTALEVLLGEKRAAVIEEKMEESEKSAHDVYEEMLAALKDGDWGLFGQKMDELGGLLKE